MGAEYTAIAVIGCKIDSRKLWSKQITRLCKHGLPENAQFCPTCGKSTIPVEVYVPRFDCDYSECTAEDFEHHSCGYAGRAGEVQLLTSTDANETYAGLIAATTGWGGKGQCIAVAGDWSSLRTRTKTALEKLDLWNEDTFGLWAVLYCSY